MSEIACLPDRNHLDDLRTGAELDDGSSAAWMATAPERVGRDVALRARLLVALVDGAGSACRVGPAMQLPAPREARS